MRNRDGIGGFFFVALALAAVSLVPLGASDPPGRVNFQGMARDAGGTALDGSIAMVFRFYDDPAAGTVLWEETYDPVSHSPAVAVSAGLFTVPLGDPAHRTAGSETSFQGVFSNHGAVYLGVKVGEDAEMTPRIQVTSAPFAVNSEALGGKSAGDFAEAVHTHSGSQITGPVASAINADTLDGSHAASFAASSHEHAATDITSGSLPAARGGTGLASPGASGNLLTSNGSTWASSAPPTAASTGAVVDAADTTLTRSGAGSSASPFKLALNLSKTNIWTGAQTFQTDTLFPGPGVWTSSGKVGIGTLSPTYGLEMEQAWTVARLTTTGNANGSILELKNATNNPAPALLGAINFNNAALEFPGQIAYVAPSDSMTFTTKSSQRMVIDGSGNVGIGALHPEHDLDILKDGASVRLTSVADSQGPALFLRTTYAASPLCGKIVFQRGNEDLAQVSGNTDAELNFATNGYYRMTLDASGNLGLGNLSPGFPLTFANQTGDKISLYTSSPSEIYGFGVGSSLLQVFSSKSSTDIAFGYGSSASFTERMRIKGTGKVGIGLDPTYQFQLSTDSAAKPGTSTWTIASDLRLKKDVAPFTDGLEVLNKIKPISYRYNGLAGLPRDMPCIGVAAQEIKDVAPYTVGTFKAKLTARDSDETELYDFNSHALTFILINAVKELDTKVEALSGNGSSAMKEPKSTIRPSALPEGTGLRPKPLAADDGFRDATSPSPPVPAPLPYLAASWPVCEPVEAGDLLATDPRHPGHLCRSAVPNDSGVVGVVTSASGAQSEGPARASTDAPSASVAIAGMAQVKVDAGYGPIALNDLLVASPTPGHAMRGQSPVPGTIIGKALESLDAGTGLIRILVMLR
jgi:hypothetical protein